MDERDAILAVHVRGKHPGPDVDLGAVARGTPGFSGADLANLSNEAAICAVRGNRDVITASDFDAARDRIILGRREGSNVLLPEEKHAVAVHESGHALVAALSEHADPVAKVTILPAGQTLGVTEQLPLVERHLYGEDYLRDSLAVRLGGRAAELVVLGHGSTGAGNDLAGATELATKMVREFGLSATLGPVGYPEGGSVFLGGGGPGLSSRPYAEATQAAIDTEVARLLRQAEQRAVELPGRPAARARDGGRLGRLSPGWSPGPLCHLFRAVDDGRTASGSLRRLSSAGKDSWNWIALAGSRSTTLLPTSSCSSTEMSRSATLGWYCVTGTERSSPGLARQG